MESFLSSLKQESEGYKNTALSIDKVQRGLSIRFEELESTANIKVLNINRPKTVLERTEFYSARELKGKQQGQTARRAKTELIRERGKRPQTARNLQYGNFKKADHKKGNVSNNENIKISENKRNNKNVQWITEAPNVIATSKYPPNGNDDVFASSHHFTDKIYNDLPDDFSPKRAPKSARVWKTPLCIRRIERKLTDDEKFYGDDEPDTMKKNDRY